MSIIDTILYDQDYNVVVDKMRVNNISNFDTENLSTAVNTEILNHNY